MAAYDIIVTDMKIALDPGLYVVAVSGGVDSVVLLHALAGISEISLVVAHFDHGIRGDSVEDRRHAAALARKYNVSFVYDEGQLGSSASEALARQKRYEFLHTVRKRTGARAIVTAHHQDDLIETALLNMLRGTRRKGLGALRSHQTLQRPLLHMPKQKILEYARANGLVWREDSTNRDTRYKRNYVRHELVPKMSKQQKRALLAHIARIQLLNQYIDAVICDYLEVQPSKIELDRQSFVQLPHTVAREVMAEWFRKSNVANITAQMIEAAVVAGKTYMPGKKIVLNRHYYVEIGKKSLILQSQSQRC